MGRHAEVTSIAWVAVALSALLSVMLLSASIFLCGRKSNKVKHKDVSGCASSTVHGG